MDIKKFIMSERIENDYNKMIQNELDIIKNKTNNNAKCLYKVSECDFLRPRVPVDEMWEDANIQEFKKICNYEMIGFSGPMIKKYICPGEESDDLKIKNYYIATVLSQETKPKNLYRYYLDNLENDSDDEKQKTGQMENMKRNESYYVIHTSNTVFYLNKRSYNSLSHALLSHENPMDRIILNEEDLWVSGMFILDFYKKISCFDANNVDPIFRLPEDILDIYDRTTVIQCKRTIKTIIDMINIDELQKIERDVIEKSILIHNNSEKNNDQKYTVLEYALVKMMENNHPVIIYQMRGIIMYLSQFQYQRPIFFVAKMIGFDKKYPGMYEGLIETKHKINISPETDIKSLESDYHIDMFILNHLIKCDDEKHFIQYMIQMGIGKKFKQKSKTAEKIIDWVIEHKAFIIAKSLIDSEIIDETHKFKIVFLSQSFDLLDCDFVEKYITNSTDNQIDSSHQEMILDNLDKIIEKGLTRSFFVVLKMCPHILNHDAAFDNIIHIIKSDDCVDILEIMLKQNVKCVDQRDKNGKTPLITFAELGLNKCILKLLEYGADYELTDNNSDTFLHKLCELGHLDIVCNVIRNVVSIIDSKNDKMMTPSLVAVLNSHEEIFYVLKGLNADLDTVDIYGNTVYHYICRSKICPGLLIVNKKNKFGFTPYDYCTIDQKFYYFHDH